MSYDRHNGEVVEVTLKRVRVTDVQSTAFRGVSEDGVTRSTRTYRETGELYFPDGAVIIGGPGRSSRSSFKPKAGDVYRAKGEIWYAREYQGSGGTIVIENGDGDSFSDDRMNIKDEIRDFEMLNPKLIARDGKTVTD